MRELAAAPPADVSRASASQSHTHAMSERIFGIWSFIVVECFVFSAYFIIYLLQRMHDPDTFAGAQVELSPTFGMVNTLILLTSSWQVARSLHSARAGDYASAARQALITVSLGAVFLVSKLSEWTIELTNGFTFGVNDFFSFYYFLTGIHIVHVLIGFVFMLGAIRNLRGDSPTLESIETASIYWHMVDFLWVFIFALVYVVR